MAYVEFAHHDLSSLCLAGVTAFVCVCFVFSTLIDGISEMGS